MRYIMNEGARMLASFFRVKGSKVGGGLSSARGGQSLFEKIE